MLFPSQNMSSGYGLRPIFLADPHLPAKLVKVPDIINSEEVLLWVLIVVIHVLNWTLISASMEEEKGGFPTVSFLERKTQASAHPALRYARREIFDTLNTDDIQNRGVKNPVLPHGASSKKKVDFTWGLYVFKFSWPFIPILLSGAFRLFYANITLQPG